MLAPSPSNFQFLRAFLRVIIEGSLPDRSGSRARSLGWSQMLPAPLKRRADLSPSGQPNPRRTGFLASEASHFSRTVAGQLLTALFRT